LVIVVELGTDAISMAGVVETMPCSHDNPELFWIDDAKVVGDLIAYVRQFLGMSSRKKFSKAMLKSLKVA
jgi:hypothetical protein